jgi:hypothetical protein
MLVTTRLFLLLLLVFSQAAQGAFAGITLCREETGEVVLEWAANSASGECEGTGLTADEAEEHCGPCFDLPIPSDKVLKTVCTSPELFGLATLVVSDLFVPEYYAALPAPAPGLSSRVSEHLRSIRLLI